jgi:L-arabinokinase
LPVGSAGSIAFYISGHGFGHASRQVEIVNALTARRPDLAVFFRTSAPRWLLERTILRPFELDPRPVDTGVVQIDSLHLDETATAARARDFYATFDERADAEAGTLRRRGVRLVVSDAAPLGCEAAARAGIPSIVVSNFTWDWIYAAYAGFATDAPGVISTIRRAYRHAAAAWRLPMHGAFDPFDTIVDVPFVARHGNPDRTREEVLRALGVPADRPVALVSFGGYGAELPLDALDCADTWTVVAPADHYGELRYEDVVRAVDVVITKPGYGIISECVANGTAMVYTSRGHFIEYDVLVREMPRYLRCAYLSNEDLAAGRWRAALDAAVDAPPPPEHPRTDGADVIAQKLLVTGNW